ncbi:MAG: metallophosphoesterase family protein [Deltaproteobacteria bacterium]|nr:metallophosphoesterase family protein [Deltaproteobacteria bacterium]
MDAVLVSDLHLDGPAHPSQVAFLRFLGTLPSSTRLCVLGDAFQAWWHHDGEPFREYAPVARALLEFDLVYLPGNHDFHALDYFRAHRATVPTHARPGAAVVTRLGTLGAHLSHGDEADSSWGYVALHALLRGRAFAAAVDALPPARAWAFLHQLAGRPHGVPDPGIEAAQLALAAACPEALVAMGHTHGPRLLRRNEGYFLNTGDWVSHRSFAIVTGDVVTLSRFDG